MGKEGFYLISDESPGFKVLLQNFGIWEEEVDVALQAVLVQRGSNPGSTPARVRVDGLQQHETENGVANSSLKS